MPIKINATNTLGLVGILSDADVEFISMVGHAANWRPFTTIKADSGVSDMAAQRVHAIVMPLDSAEQILSDLSSLGIEQLRELLGDATFEGIKTEVATKFDRTIRYTQRDESEFREDCAFVVRDLGDTGAQVVLGELRTDTKQDTSDATTVVAEVSTPPTQNSFSNSFYQEIDGFCAAVQGAITLQQDLAERKNTIGAAWQSVSDWLNTSLDTVATGKFERPDPLADLIAEIQALKSELTNLTAPMGGIDMFASKDELKTFILETVNETLRAKAEETSPDTETAKAEAELQASVNALAEKLQVLEKNLSTLAEKTEALAHTPDKAASVDEDYTATKADTSKFGTLFGVKKAS